MSVSPIIRKCQQGGKIHFSIIYWICYSIIECVCVCSTFSTKIKFVKLLFFFSFLFFQFSLILFSSVWKSIFANRPIVRLDSRKKKHYSSSHLSERFTHIGMGNDTCFSYLTGKEQILIFNLWYNFFSFQP